MFAFDTAMAIFNNVPPRISFSEIDVHLPCDSMYFELSSYYEMVNRSMHPKPKMKLVDAFQKLFTAPTDLPTAIERNSLNCWDMLLLVHCLYTYVWRQTFANPLLRATPNTLYAPSTILEPLKIAIQNWKTIWDEIRSDLTREQMRHMGFETSADSYWTLTKLIVHRFDPKSSSSPTEAQSASASAVFPGTQRSNVGGMQIHVKDEPMSAGSGPHNGAGGGWSTVDFMPIDTDCDSQGAHLRKILRRPR